MYTVQIRFYNENSGKVAWVYKPPMTTLAGLMECIRRCISRHQTLCVLNPEHPDYLLTSQMRALRTNIMVRKSGKLVKWKHWL
ncbi:MAG: hypothetical protein ACRDCE_05905 [Cetobacterium sp.]|uniref:hypothetical protein n=1 Tax=Cetobacterium sp. TaxID=2071632 RepID=UPI003EE45ABE